MVGIKLKKSADAFTASLNDHKNKDEANFPSISLGINKNYLLLYIKTVEKTIIMKYIFEE